jgi:hypothetical protein
MLRGTAMRIKVLPSSQIQPEITEDKVQKLRDKIAAQIRYLNSEIDSHRTDEKSIDVWIQKINVLNACLSGGIADIQDALSRNAFYKYQWKFPKGWCPSSFSKTQGIVDEVIRLLTVKPLAFLQNSKALTFESNGFNDVTCMLNEDIKVHLLGRYLDNTRDIINFAKTSTNHYRLFQNNQAAILLKNLLIHAVLGEWNAARKIWQRYPHILTLKGSVKHRYLYENHTAYQIAWRNQESKIIEEMNAILSLEEQQKQFYEIFPDGQLVKHNKLGLEYAQDVEHAKKLLLNVCDAVTNDLIICEKNMNTRSLETKAALQALHNYLNPDIAGQCQTGLVSDVRLLLEAVTYYEKNRPDFQNRRTFWFACVEEMIAFFLPTGYLRAHCQGIHSVDIRKEVPSDKGCLLANGSLSYFQIFSADLELKAPFFVDMFGGLYLKGWIYNEGRNIKDAWLNFISQNDEALKKLIPPKPETSLTYSVKK